MERGIREVCEEALGVLRIENSPGDMICTEDIAGYIYEILAILDESEDDGK